MNTETKLIGKIALGGAFFIASPLWIEMWRVDFNAFGVTSSIIELLLKFFLSIFGWGAIAFGIWFVLSLFSRSSK